MGLGLVLRLGCQSAQFRAGLGAILVGGFPLGRCGFRFGLLLGWLWSERALAMLGAESELIPPVVSLGLRLSWGWISA